jgi:hypothetical protein
MYEVIADKQGESKRGSKVLDDQYKSNGELPQKKLFAMFQI